MQRWMTQKDSSILKLQTFFQQRLAYINTEECVVWNLINHKNFSHVLIGFEHAFFIQSFDRWWVLLFEM